MKWPFVHRARLEAEVAYSRLLSDMLDNAHAQRDGMLARLIAMKQQGFAPVPPRSETPKGVAYRGQELVSRDKLIRQFSEEPGVTPEQAEQAADQVLAELQ